MRWMASFLAALVVLMALGLDIDKAAAQASGEKHWVKGYTRKDGTYVPGHWAKNPKQKNTSVSAKAPAKSKTVAKAPKSPSVGSGKATSPKAPAVREKKATTPKSPSVRESRPSRVSSGGGSSSRGSSSRGSSSRSSSSRK